MIESLKSFISPLWDVNDLVDLAAHWASWASPGLGLQGLLIGGAVEQSLAAGAHLTVPARSRAAGGHQKQPQLQIPPWRWARAMVAYSPRGGPVCQGPWMDRAGLWVLETCSIVALLEQELMAPRGEMVSWGLNNMGGDLGVWLGPWQPGNNLRALTNSPKF